MNVTLIWIDAQDASGGAMPVFLSSHDIPEACHLGGNQWEPALAQLPDFALDFFGGAFSGQVSAPRTSFAVATSGLAAFAATPSTRARFADARVRIWHGDITSAATVDLGPLTLRFDGRIANEPTIDDATRTATFEAAVQDSWANKPLLALFAGTGAIEGPADLTGQVKPLVLGNARFCGATLIDRVDNVWMVSSGPLQAVNAVYDRIASLGPSAGNFADLASLKAASIPNGSWGTCLALGLVRFGAPPDGRVSFDVSGSNSGTGGYVRLPGAIIRRIADLAGGTVNAASLTGLDSARPYNLALQLRDQATAREAIGQIADSVGAVAGVSLRGELFAQALSIGTPSDTLAPDDSSTLRVAPVEELAKAAPNWRLATEAELTFEVHSVDEAAFEYRWQGEYSASRVYRIDDVVTGPDGAAWAYINATPAAGQALPMFPTTLNAFWQVLQRPGSAAVAPANANRVPFSRMEGNRGWGLGFNSHSLSIASIFDVFQGMAYFELAGTATAPGQIVSIAGQPLVANQFRLSPQERVSVSARVLAEGAINSWQLALWGTRTDGSTYIIQTLSGGPRNIVDGQVAMFADIPGNVVGGRLELYGTTNAAGAFRLILSEPMLTSAAPGQTIHPPFSLGPNASDGATVGAPNGTPVGGMLAEALVAQAAQAASDATAANAAAFAANTAISVITSDSFLSRDEKPEIRKQRDAIVSEYPTIRARAISFGVAVGNYDADYTALVAYLGGLELGGSTDTAITRTTFNTVFTDYYAERQTVLDGIAAATSNNLITVNGSGILSGIGTANIIVDNARLPLGSNAVVNSDFTRGKFGWRWRDGGFENDWGVNLPGWFGQRNVMWATQAGTLASNGNNDLYPNAIWAGAGLANALQFAMPVVQGDRVAVSTLAAQHRCTFQLFILFFDGAGTLITAPATQGGTPGGAGNGDPANFTLLTEIANAPTNARWAIPMMRMLGTGENDPYIFFTEPMISKIAAGQTVAPRYIPGRVDSLADETATAQRSVEPQFPSIEIKQGQAGHTGNRTVTHTAKRGTAAISGGTWSLPAQNLGAGSASVNSAIGTVTLSGIVQSGSYTLRYTHTDGIPTEITVNVSYVPEAAGGSSAKVGRQAVTTSTADNSDWQTVLTLTVTGAPAGRVNFGGNQGLSFLEPQGGTGTNSFEARLQLDGVTLVSLTSQPVTVADEIEPTDFAGLFNGSYATGAGTRVFTIQLRRTFGTGVLNVIQAALEATIIAS